MIASARPLRDHELIRSLPSPGRDREIHAAAAAALAASKYIPLRQLNCRVTDGVVEITGTVSSFYLKQLAQAAMLQLNGGVVRNLVQVIGESIALIATDCRSTVATGDGVTSRGVTSGGPPADGAAASGPN